MDRIFKGRGVKKHVDSYCIVDLETTGVFVRKAKIIEISAVRVRDNQIDAQYSRLVNPGCLIPAEASAVCHITDEMVKECPCLEDVIDSFMDFVGGDVIVGYNNAGFDMNLLYDAWMALRGKPFTNDYIDVLHAARRCLSGTEDHKLETVCRYYHIDTQGEHRALKDCLLTKAVYDSLYRDYGDAAFGKREEKGTGTVHFSQQLLTLRELRSLLEAVTGEGISSPDRLFSALDRIPEEGSEIPEEMQGLFPDFLDPVKSRGCHEKIETVRDRHIVVTGDFYYGSREEVHALIEAAGGIADKGVKKATDYVVVGGRGSAAWKTGRYGSKIEKAIALKEKGLPVKIVEEYEFIPALKRMIERGMQEE